jgi:hypothetical protein
MRKPLYSKQAVERLIGVVETNIEALRQGIRKKEEMRAEFGLHIKLHEQWEKNPVDKKPMYNHASLKSGILSIDDDIRVINAAIERESRKRNRFVRSLGEIDAWEEWAKENPGLASGVIEIKADQR